MCTQNAFRYFDRIAYDEVYAGVALSSQEGDRMCRAMGEKDILFLRNHGIIVAGPTVAQAYDDLYYLERAAMVQVLAMQTGRPLHNIDAALAEQTYRQIADDTVLAEQHFESLKRLLDRDEPGWRKSTA
jgi:ribulose-5-phosphate 4-epimerase/fuculose-1-phosphate aldolase